MAHNEMSHFVTNIHNYILVEVLESAWTVFLNGLHQVEDLDSLIILQKKFVLACTSKTSQHYARIGGKDAHISQALAKCTLFS